MKHLSYIVKYLLGWPLSLLAIYFIFKASFLNNKQNLLNIGSINYYLLFLGFSCFLLYFFVRAYVWKRILKEQGYNLSLKEVSFLWGNEEIKRFIPGKIWPFLGRTLSFSKKGVEKKVIIASMLYELQFFVLASAFISVSSISWFLKSLIPNFSLLNLIDIFSFLIISIIVLLYISNSLWVKRINIEILNRFAKRLLPHFPIRNNLILFLISSFYMFLFGLGTYFTVSSLIQLDSKLLLLLSSFFTLSFLIGFLSFITPMGLGVREGVITIGLSNITTTSLAGISSIYSRVILVLSEIIFLFISYLWMKSKKEVLDDFLSFFRKYKYETLLFISIFIYILYFTTASFLRYENYYTGRFDLGNMSQTVWNSANGRIFQLTDPDGTEIISRLAFHADFILILLSPFYLLWSDPRMLLLIQTIVLGLGALVIYKISLKVLENKGISVLLSILFLLNPSVQNTNLYDFHPVTLATTFLLSAFYFLKERKYIYFLFFAILSALCKEQLWIIISLFGIYILIRSYAHKHILKKNNLLIKERILGTLIFIIPLIIGFYLISSAIPKARGGNHFALSYYSDFGNSPVGIVKNIFFNPSKTLSLVFEKERVLYLKQVFSPLGYLPFLSPQVLLFTIPDLTINLLSNNANLHQIYYQYTATITPFLFIATIYAVKFLKLKYKSLPFWVFGIYLTLSTIYAAKTFGPLPFSQTKNTDMFEKQQPYKNTIDNFLMNIPKEFSIAATNNIGSHLSHRQKIFTIPLGIDKADIIVFLLNDPYAQPSLKAQKEMAAKLKNDNNYIQIFKQADFVVFQRKK